MHQPIGTYCIAMFREIIFVIAMIAYSVHIGVVECGINFIQDKEGGWFEAMTETYTLKTCRRMCCPRTSNGEAEGRHRPVDCEE